MTPHDVLVAAWETWLALVRKKKRGEYVRDRSLRDAQEAVEDAVEHALAVNHRDTPSTGWKRWA